MTEANKDDQIHSLQCMVEQLQSTCREASRTSTLKSDFLASMSHEIRIPMNSVIGISQLLLQTTLDNEQRELALTLSESAEALLCTINDILDFSKIEAGKFDLCPSEFDVVSLVEGCVDIFTRQAEQKGISIFSFVHPDVPRRVIGDSRYVRRILLNLISNAVKFTSNGGIGVHAELTATANGRANVRFTVRDTGIGINESTIEQLFQPYHQADETIGSKYGGTGLGLSICKQLCELMNGAIGLTSLLNQGSDFWFELPFVPVDDSSNLFESQSAVLKRKKMLLVNYGRYAVGAVISYCRAWKMALDVVANIPEAIEAVRNKNYDIVAVNAETIDQTLASFAEATASNRSKSKLLLVSSKQSRSLSQRAMGIGFAAHLTFPLRQTRLVDCLLQLTETKEAETKSPSPVAQAKEPLLKFVGAPILIVEDNVVNQKVLMLQLKQLGYDAITVSNGADAVETVRKNRVSLVLMDCEMPGMDGFTASELIRQHELETGIHVPILAVTGHVGEQAQSRCLKAGMDDFLAKPVRPQALQSVIERWLPMSVATATGAAHGGNGSQRPATASAAIDLHKVRAMCSSDEETRELLQLFLCSSRTLVAELESATQAYDAVAVKNACQQLRGCCNSVGATQISKLVIGIEMAADEESWHAARAFIRQLRKAHTEAQDFVTRFWRTYH